MYTEIKLADWRKLKNKTGLYTVDFNDPECGKDSLIPGKFYYKDSLYHNEAGPARVLVTGEKQYWLAGKWYQNFASDKQWTAFVKTV